MPYFKSTFILFTGYFIAIVGIISCTVADQPTPQPDRKIINNESAAKQSNVKKFVLLDSYSSESQEGVNVINTGLVDATNGRASVSEENENIKKMMETIVLDKKDSENMNEDIQLESWTEDQPEVATESLALEDEQPSTQNQNFRMQLHGPSEQGEAEEQISLASSSKKKIELPFTNEDSGFNGSQNLPAVLKVEYRQSELPALPALGEGQLEGSLVSGENSNEYPQIHIYTNSKVDSYINLYSERKRELFIKGLERSAVYLPMILKILREENLPESLAYLAMVESNFHPRAVSRAKATGLWQFMRATGRQYKLSQSWWHDERLDPEKSTRAAARLMKDLYKRFGSWELALASYNSGSGKVRRAIAKNKAKGLPTDYWSLKLPRETKGYVPAFLAVNIIFRNLDKYGFELPEMLEWDFNKEKLAVPGGVKLQEVASKLKIEHSELKELNPALKYAVTPANVSSYSIWVPQGTSISNQDTLFASLKKLKKDGWLQHKVRRGDTLWDISRAYGIRVSDVLAYNPTLRRKYLRPGTYIMIPSGDPGTVKNARVKAATPKKSSGQKYYVKRGDTLIKIARLFGTTVSSLVKSNANLRSQKQLLQIGMPISIN